MGKKSPGVAPNPSYLMTDSLTNDDPIPGQWRLKCEDNRAARRARCTALSQIALKKPARFLLVFLCFRNFVHSKNLKSFMPIPIRLGITDQDRVSSVIFLY